MTSFVFLGDSNPAEYYVTGSQNMVSILANRFSLTKYNKSVSGNKTAQMTARVATDVLALNPNEVWLMPGTNDGAYAFEQDIAASVWVPQWLSDVENLIDAVASVPKIFVVSPPPARRAKLCAEWPDAIRQEKLLCAAKGVIYCPMYEGFISTAVAMMGYTSATQYYFPDPDRFHLNAAGHGLGGAILGDCRAAN